MSGNFDISATVRYDMAGMTSAGNETQFEIAKGQAEQDIGNAISATTDQTLKDEYGLLLQIVDMSSYMKPPTVTGGASAEDLLDAMVSMIGLSPDAMLDIAKALIEAARDQAMSTALMRNQYMQGIVDSANAQYTCDIQAAQDAQTAAVIEAATQIATSAISMIVAVVATKFALESAANAKKIDENKSAISDLEAAVAKERKLGAPPCQQTIDDNEATIKKLQDGIATAQAKVTSCSAISNALTTFDKTLQVFDAIAKVAASYYTVQSKTEEADSKLYATGQQLESTQRSAADDAYRSLAELVNSVVDMLKETATTMYKGPQAA